MVYTASIVIAGESIEIPPGFFLLGRDLLKGDDKGCSRKQIELHFDSEHGQLMAKRLGMNVSKRINDAGEADDLVKGDSMLLQDGDRFTLVNDRLPVGPISIAQEPGNDSDTEEGPFEDVGEAPVEAVPVVKPSAGQGLKRMETLDFSLDRKRKRDAAPKPVVKLPCTLALPPLATTDVHMFKVSAGVEVAASAIASFLQHYKEENIRIYVVDTRPELLHELDAALPEDSRVRAVDGNLVSLGSLGIPCSVIVNETNWRLRPTTSGVNQQIHKAAGDSLYNLTKEKYTSAESGRAYPVELPSASPLREEQVHHVVHVVPPNMNPEKPDYLNEDYDVGGATLLRTYMAALAAFAHLVGLGERAEFSHHQLSALEIASESQVAEVSPEPEEPPKKKKKTMVVPKKMTTSRPKRHTSNATWFEKLFGFEERDYAQTRAQFKVDGSCLTSLANGRSFQCGDFETPTLKELRERALKCIKAEKAQTGAAGTVRVIHHATEDVFSEHIRPNNSGAMFQVASQFNCLEFVGPQVTPERGVAGYSHDMTQGPACAIAGGAATVFRNYFAEVDGVSGQRKNAQINNLCTLDAMVKNQNKKYWVVKNGYTFSSEAQLATLKKVLSKWQRAKLRDTIRIGVQTGVEITFTRRYEPTTEQQTPQIVGQAFCSAASVAYSQVGASHWEHFATLFLEAAYEATLWAGVLNRAQNKSPRVYLTLLGGGVYGNPEEWIANAIARAVARVQKAGATLDVVVLHFRYVSMSFESSLDACLDKHKVKRHE